MLGKRCQTQKTTYRMIPFTVTSRKDKSMVTESRSTFARRWEKKTGYKLA